jgi:hypothetical protein
LPLLPPWSMADQSAEFALGASCVNCWAGARHCGVRSRVGGGDVAPELAMSAVPSGPGGGWLPRPARWPCWRGGHPRRPGRVERRRASARESGWDRPGPALCRRPSAPTAAPDGGVFQPLQPPTSAASRRSQRDRRLWPPSNCRCHADRVSYTALIPPARNPTAQKYQFWRRRQQSCPPWRGRPYRRISHTYRGSVDHAVRSAGPVRAGRITPGRRPAMPLAGLLARNPPAAPARKLSRTYTASTRPGPSGSSSTWRHDPVP